MGWVVDPHPEGGPLNFGMHPMHEIMNLSWPECSGALSGRERVPRLV